MAKLVTSKQDLIDQIATPAALKLNSGEAQRGIDNHHIDVKLSDYFVFVSKELIEALIQRAKSGKRINTINSEEIFDFRTAYEDMITTSLHRTKIDITLEQLKLLQFAIPKFLISESKRQLSALINDLEERVAEQQGRGARFLLDNQAQLRYMRQNQSLFIYRTCWFLFQQIQRVENSQLKPVRTRIMGADFSVFLNVLYSPMLASLTPDEPRLLLESYSIWPDAGRGFSELNQSIEAFFIENSLVAQKQLPLNGNAIEIKAEPYDVLGGLFSVQNLLGKSHDQKDQLLEVFSWLDEPGNFRRLFDVTNLDSISHRLIEDGASEAASQFSVDSKALLQLAKKLRKEVISDAELLQLIAAYRLKPSWTSDDEWILDLNSACEYIAGDAKQVSRLDETKRDVALLLVRLDDIAKEVKSQLKIEGDEYVLRLLTDLSRYRLHLKYYRFAHRAFNRINVLTDPEKIQLAESTGNLYALIGKDEIKADDLSQPEIVHHAILKVELRGGIKVTSELMKAGLNPASYFSLHFFEPINELLKQHKGTKVKVEGDAVVIAFYEYSNEPDQWYCVSRICGMAREILAHIRSKNALARKNKLPILEIGMGLSYRGDKPMFLVDDDRPIMISTAVARASQLSASHKSRRDQFRDRPFNVMVAKTVEGDEIQHNIDGILLDEIAFRKLMAEVKLTRLGIKIQHDAETMFVGCYPDYEAKDRDIVVRRGQVGRLIENDLSFSDKNEQFYYEVLTDTKMINKLVSLNEQRMQKE